MRRLGSTIDGKAKPRLREQSPLAPIGIALLLAAGGSVGCGDGLDPEAAKSIGPGNASGSAASGLYRVSLERTGCTGSCGEANDLFVGPGCLGGGNFSVPVTQTDGVLEIELGFFFVVPSLKGSLDASGDFELGGVRLEETGFSGVFRVEGTLVNQTIAGSARGRLFGEGNGLSLDCVTQFSVQGSKLE